MPGGLRAGIYCVVHIRQERPARRQPIDAVFPNETVFVLGHDVLYQNGAVLFSEILVLVSHKMVPFCRGHSHPFSSLTST
jgi:hypothetical protein